MATGAITELNKKIARIDPNLFVLKSGDEMAGDLIMTEGQIILNADPMYATSAARKSYIDAKILITPYVSMGSAGYAIDTTKREACGAIETTLITPPVLGMANYAELSKYAIASYTVKSSTETTGSIYVGTNITECYMQREAGINLSANFFAKIYDTYEAFASGTINFTISFALIKK